MSAEPVLVRSPLAEELLETRELGPPNEVILDIETTGLEPDIYRLVAIGLMDAETGETDIIFVEREGDEEARETIIAHLREDLEMTRMVLGRLRPYVEAYERLVPSWWRW